MHAKVRPLPYPTPMRQTTSEKWKQALADVARSEKVKILQSFFKTGPGEYAEGDVMIGVTVPDNRAVAREFAEADNATIADMLRSPVHEHRLSGLLAMVHAYERSKDPARRAHIIDMYLANADRCNNWDLVDLSAPKLLGPELAAGRCLDRHAELSAAESMWRRRIAIVSTLHLVMKHRRTSEAVAECDRHVSDAEPQIHKAVGWVMREVGKKDLGALLDWLDRNIGRMSATTLSYATEKLDKSDRRAWQLRRREARQ